MEDSSILIIAKDLKGYRQPPDIAAHGNGIQPRSADRKRSNSAGRMEGWRKLNLCINTPETSNI